MSAPSAKNGISSYAFHFQRRKYIRDAYSKFREDSAIDLWYGPQALYGRVNTKGESVLLDPSRLTNFPSNPQVVAVNFVVDAFEDFRTFMIKGFQQGKFNVTKTFLDNLLPQIAYQEPFSAQEDILTAFNERLYKGYIPENQKDREIKDIKDYVRILFEYFEKTGRSVPLTLSTMTQTVYASPMSSGLMIELADETHSKDAVKYNNFILDPNFDLYQQAARKFGFKIDYNTPWRMVADISTKEMKQYMSAYSIGSLNQLFEEYYNSPVVDDLVTLKEFVFNSYNDFVEFNPYTKIPRISKDGQRTKFCMVDRFEISPEAFNEMFDELYWLNFYFRVRSIELKLTWTKPQLAKQHRRIKKILKDLDTQTVIEYIERELAKQARN